MSSPLARKIPPGLAEHLAQTIQAIFEPQVRSLLAPQLLQALQTAVGKGVKMVFWVSLAASMASLVFCCFLPRSKNTVS